MKGLESGVKSLGGSGAKSVWREPERDDLTSQSGLITPISLPLSMITAIYNNSNNNNNHTDTRVVKSTPATDASVSTHTHTRVSKHECLMRVVMLCIW